MSIMRCMRYQWGDLNPIEELECAFPIISVAGEGLAQWGDYRA